MSSAATPKSAEHGIKHSTPKSPKSPPKIMPQPPPQSQYYSLRWNNYQSNMTSVFHELLEAQSFVDVTLACEDNSLKAHKVSFILISNSWIPIIIIFYEFSILGRIISMFGIFSKAFIRKSLQTSDNNYAIRHIFHRSAVYYWIRL